MNRITRRKFVTATTAAGAGYWSGVAPAQNNRSANGTLKFACIGVGGRGTADSADAAKHGDVVAICDIDEIRGLGGGAPRYPRARKFIDFRKMLEAMHRDIDAVTISTPDHTHAAAAIMAMKLGKHCFCQKPLARSVYEIRRMADVAREEGVVTQMGSQDTAESGFRAAVEVLRSGMIGEVGEVHVWSNKSWPQERPVHPSPESPPPHIHWNEWLGPAAAIPYSKEYHPAKWRGFWSFGQGALGDMATHTMSLPAMALDLFDPISVESEHDGHDRITFPKWTTVRWEFAPTAKRSAVTMYWYDGGKKPAANLFDGVVPNAAGCLIVGSRGKLYSPTSLCKDFQLLPRGDFTSKQPQWSILPPSPGHFHEFVNAIHGRGIPLSSFPALGAPLTEMVVLGNLSVWASKKILWEAANMRATNAPDVDQMIKPTYRSGYSIA